MREHTRHTFSVPAVPFQPLPISDLGISNISMSDKLSISRGGSGTVISSFLTGNDMLVVLQNALV